MIEVISLLPINLRKFKLLSVNWYCLLRTVHYDSLMCFARRRIESVCVTLGSPNIASKRVCFFWRVLIWRPLSVENSQTFVLICPLLHADVDSIRLYEKIRKSLPPEKRKPYNPIFNYIGLHSHVSPCSIVIRKNNRIQEHAFLFFFRLRAHNPAVFGHWLITKCKIISFDALRNAPFASCEVHQTRVQRHPRWNKNKRLASFSSSTGKLLMSLIYVWKNVIFPQALLLTW